MLDIYLVTAAELTPARERIPHRNALYRNLGGWKFEDVSKQAGVDAAAWGNGVCAGDVDGDGRLDLYVTNWGPNFLFRNRGDGTFEDVAARAGVAAGGWSTGCTFFDADADGDLDLYVARYVETTWDSVVRAQRTLVWRNGPRIMVGPAGLPGEADLFFENLGNGRFVEATEAHGLSDAARAYGFGVVATDYDDDGFVDLFVANDSNPNFLYRNLGNGRFESVGLVAGVAVNGEAAPRRGWAPTPATTTATRAWTSCSRRSPTIATRSIATSTAGSSRTRAWRRASPAPTFVRMGWGTAFLDADLDGRLDLFFANGHIFADVDKLPAARGNLPSEEPAPAEPRHALPRRLGARGSRPAGRARRPRPRRRRSRQRRRSRPRRQQHGRCADAAREPAGDRSTTGWRSASSSATGNRFAIGAKVTIEPRTAEAGARDPLGRQLSLAERSARVLRPGRLRGSRDVEVRMPGGRRWRWKELAADRLHVLELSRHRPASRKPVSRADRPARTATNAQVASNRGVLSRALVRAAAIGALLARTAQVAGASRLSARSSRSRNRGAVSRSTSNRAATRSRWSVRRRSWKRGFASCRRACAAGGAERRRVAEALLDSGLSRRAPAPVDGRRDEPGAARGETGEGRCRADLTLDARAFGAELRRLVERLA